MRVLQLSKGIIFMLFMISFVHMQVLSLRTLHEQLLWLLSSQEQQTLGSMQFLCWFEPTASQSVTQPLWRAVVAQYSRGMEPVEQWIAGKLRQKLSKLDAHPQQVSTCIQYM